MTNDDIDQLFDRLNDTFDTEVPHEGHQERFLEKLNASQGTVAIQKNKKTWWKPLTIAASIALLSAILFRISTTTPSINEKVDQISPEVSQTQLYFASLIEEQVKQLENESTPETKKIIDDTMSQLQKLDKDFKLLEKDLVNGGNSKLILQAMVTNFQTRIDLLQDVLKQISTIKKIKNYNDANYTI